MSEGPACGIVPRETVEPLRSLEELIARWNRRINLIARNEVPQMWRRHIMDSAQLVPLAPRDVSTWLDLGSGAGFPGLVCAIVAKVRNLGISFTLVEADGRKAAFLREAARQLSIEVSVIERRIDEADLPPHDVVSARALAPLDRLLCYAEPFCHGGTRLIFPKGRQANSELTLARRAWHIRVVRVPSCTDPGGTILQISEVRRRK